MTIKPGDGAKHVFLTEAFSERRIVDVYVRTDRGAVLPPNLEGAELAELRLEQHGQIKLNNAGVTGVVRCRAVLCAVSILWSDIYYMCRSGDRLHCIDWANTPKSHYGEFSVPGLMAEYLRACPEAHWFDQVAIGGPLDLTRLTNKIMTADEPAPVRSRKLPNGWRVISGGR